MSSYWKLHGKGSTEGTGVLPLSSPRGEAAFRPGDGRVSIEIVSIILIEGPASTISIVGVGAAKKKLRSVSIFYQTVIYKMFIVH